MKQMVRAVPGALDAELRKRKRTQAEFAQERPFIDRKTLRAINRGDPVKHSTLEKVTNKLKIPVQHLLEAGNPSEPNEEPQTAAPNSIVIRGLKAGELRALLVGASVLNWKLFLDQVDSDTSRFLLGIEDILRNWWIQLEREDRYEEGDSLSNQLERLELASACEDGLEKLKARSIALLGGEYLFWKLEDTCPYPEERHCYEFTSNKSVILAFAPISLQSKRLEVNVGVVPPVEVGDDYWPVFVNGVEINPRPRDRRNSFSRDLDDEVPF